MLTCEQREIIFNLGEVRLGDLIHARHFSWEKGRNGLIADVSKDIMKVQFIPEIGNVSNYFYIRPEEVAEAWEVRWSHDLVGIHTAEGGDD